MKKLILTLAAIGLLAADVAAQGGGPPGGGRGAAPDVGAQQLPQGKQAPQGEGRRQRPPGGPQGAPQQPPQRPPQATPQQSPRPPVVVQQPPAYRPAPGYRPDRDYRDRPPIYRPAPPSYRPPPPIYRPAPPVYVPSPPVVYAPPPTWRHRRSYDWCRDKAARLHEFEWRMQQDGRVSRDEARIARGLRADLANSCGGGRWAPDRGWYYR